MQLSTQKAVDKETFRQIFIDHWASFKERYPYYETMQYNEVVQKMLGCGKELGGYTEYICFNCGRDTRKVCFTCKSCFCLSCAKKYVDDVVEQVSSVLIPGVMYRHIILTVPEQLRIYFYRARHEGGLLSAFIRCGYVCMTEVVKVAKRQELKIGLIMVVQTHGRSGKYNPHLHIIMTNGGINESTEKWVDLNYFPYEIVHKKWEYHLFEMLKRQVGTPEIRKVIDRLWKEYPRGLVAHVTKGRVPEACNGLCPFGERAWKTRPEGVA